MMIMKYHQAYNSISQMPVVLIPIEFDRDINDQNPSSQHSVVLRTFLTKDFMTGKPAVPGETFPLEMLDEIYQTIKTEVPGISRILYDLTSKPPGKILMKIILNLFLIFFF